MKRTDKTTVITLGILCLLVSFIFFHFFYPYHLYYREQSLLFLYTPGYLLSYFDKPAWLACLAGDYLTQYYYLTGGGAIILSLVLLLLGYVLWIAFRNFLSCKIALIPALLLIIYETCRNFGLNYELSSTLSLAGGASMFILHESLIRRKTVWTWLSLLLLPLGYWLFGYGVWLYLLFLVIYTLKSTRQYLFPLIGIATVLIVVLLLRGNYLLTIRQSLLYPAITLKCSKPNMRMEKMLAIDTEAYFENWHTVKQLAVESQIKNTFVTYYYNISRMLLERLPDGLMTFYQPGPLGLFQEVGPSSTVLGIRMSNEVWYRLGDMTLAEHSAILGMIFSPNHKSSRMIKRLAEINLIKGDDEAAWKFLRMLSKTKFHKKWAEKRLPGHQNENMTEWIKRNQSLIATTDVVRYPGDYPTALRHLLTDNPDNLRALDYLLCYSLLTKDIKSFVADYKQYAGTTASSRLYSEALLIYLAFQNASPEEVASYHIHPEVIREFSEYTQLYEKHHAQSLSLQTEFRKTYWFYYHFATFTSNEK